jgi:hypothetical protein
VTIFNENFGNLLTINASNFSGNLLLENPAQFRKILNLKIVAKLGKLL